MSDYTQQYKITDDTITRFDFNFSIAQGSSVNVYYWNGNNNTTPNEINDIVPENLYTLFYNSEKDSTDGYIQINFDIDIGGELTITPTLGTVINVDFTQTSQLNPENLNKAFAQLTDPLNYMFSLYQNLSFRYDANVNINNISSYNALLPPLEDQSFFLRSGTNIINESISNLQKFLASTITGYMLEIDKTELETNIIPLIGEDGVPWKNINETNISVFKNGLRLSYNFGDFVIDNHENYLNAPLLLLSEDLILSDKLTITTNEGQGNISFMNDDGSNFILNSNSKIASNNLSNLTNKNGEAYYLVNDSETNNVAFCNTSNPILNNELILDNSFDKSIIYTKQIVDEQIILPNTDTLNIGYSFTLFNKILNPNTYELGVTFIGSQNNTLEYPNIYINGLNFSNQSKPLEISTFSKLDIAMVNGDWYIKGDITTNGINSGDYFGNVRVANSKSQDNSDFNNYWVPNINYLNEVSETTIYTDVYQGEYVASVPNSFSFSIDLTSDTIAILENCKYAKFKVTYCDYTIYDNPSTINDFSFKCENTEAITEHLFVGFATFISQKSPFNIRAADYLLINGKNNTTSLDFTVSLPTGDIVANYKPSIIIILTEYING